MLKAKLILPMEESDWVIPIVIKKDWKGICIRVDCMGLNADCIHGSFPTP